MTRWQRWRGNPCRDHRYGPGKRRHLASNLGVVELTLALHRVFEVPTIGLSGTPAIRPTRTSSSPVAPTNSRPYANRAGFRGSPRVRRARTTSLAPGMRARVYQPVQVSPLATRVHGDDASVVTVIGDGAFTSGVVFEALNHAGDLGLPLVLILNDNGLSISPNVGALGRNLARAGPTTGVHLPLTDASPRPSAQRRRPRPRARRGTSSRRLDSPIRVPSTAMICPHSKQHCRRPRPSPAGCRACLHAKGSRPPRSRGAIR